MDQKVNLTITSAICVQYLGKRVGNKTKIQPFKKKKKKKFSGWVNYLNRSNWETLGTQREGGRGYQEDFCRQQSLTNIIFLLLCLFYFCHVFLTNESLFFKHLAPRWPGLYKVLVIFHFIFFTCHHLHHHYCSVLNTHQAPGIRLDTQLYSYMYSYSYIVLLIYIYVYIIPFL